MIEVQGLTKKYDGFVAVDNISFSIGKSEVVGFLGPNGAGKTTTLRVLTGYFPPTEGSCKIAGYDIELQGVEAKSRIGYLPENNPLYNEMKVIEYLEFLGALRGIESPKNRIKDVAGICGIKEVISQTIGELSKGYRQRVGLAQAILHDPEILIMDEPTEGLDPNQVIEVRELIKELGKEKTVLISTHRLPEVEATCKRILIINRGRIVADAKRDELHRISKGREVVELELKGPKEKVLQVIQGEPNIDSIEVKEEGLAGMPSPPTPTSTYGRGKEEEIVRYEILAKTDPRESLFNLCVANGWTIIDMHRRVVSLESVFRELTQE